MSVTVHPCNAKRPCDGVVLYGHTSEHLTREEAEQLIRDLQIELDHEHQAETMGEGSCPPAA